MKVIVGLGNPGSQYVNTRHNAGFCAVDELAPPHSSFKSQHKSLVQKIRIGDEPVILVKPQTYMNLSGQAVNEVLSFYKLKVSDLIVLVDDVNLELGRFRIRSKGSHGGQNGLKDIIKYVGQEFIRVRIGVGLVPPKWDLANFVLSKLTKTDKQIFEDMISKIPNLIECLIKKGLPECMNQFNGEN